MITVSILINGKAIFTRSAVNVTTDLTGDIQIYESDDGSIVSHNPKDGAIKLAHLLLDKIKEPGEPR